MKTDRTLWHSSEECLYEFQIIENGVKYQTFVASLVFDSLLQPATSQLRGKF